MEKRNCAFTETHDERSDGTILNERTTDTKAEIRCIDQSLFSDILSIKDFDQQLAVFSALIDNHCYLSSFDIVGNLFSCIDEQRVGSYPRYRKLMRMIVRLGYRCTGFDLTRGIRMRKLYFVRFVIEMLPIQKILAEELYSEGLISLLFIETGRLWMTDLTITTVILKLLLYCGCNVNFKDRIGETCLQKLCRQRKTPIEFFSLLLSFGADKRQQIFGKLPFDLARNSSQSIEVLGLLRL